MGIQKVSEIYKAKYLGISWQAIALSSATIIGLICVYYYPNGVNEPQLVSLTLVKDSLPLISSLVVCAVLDSNHECNGRTNTRSSIQPIRRLLQKNSSQACATKRALTSF